MKHIVLKSKSITRVLWITCCWLVIVSFISQLVVYSTGQKYGYSLQKLFFLGMERNVPTSFSVSLMLVAAMLLALITRLKITERSYIYHWGILSMGFMVMAFDEAWAFHERLMRPMRSLLGGNHLGIFYYAWVIPAMALVLFLGVIFFKFLLHLPKRTRLIFIVSAMLFLGGAIGVELFEGRFAEKYGFKNLTYSLFVTVEESLEMSGLIFYIYGLLDYLAEYYQEVTLSFIPYENK